MQKEEKDSSCTKRREAVLLQKYNGEIFHLNRKRRTTPLVLTQEKAGLPCHGKRRMTPLVLSGERLSHHRKRRKTPLVLGGERLSYY
jgi:hypothetical protein